MTARPHTSDNTSPATHTDANPTQAEMETRVARFTQLEPADGYADAAIPGCERSIYHVLGETPKAPLHAGDFHMNIVRCPPGNCVPLHDAQTEQVFVALTGRWQLFWGPEGNSSLELAPQDTVSIPPGLLRGLRNISAEPSLLMAMAAGSRPGHINWPDAVRAAAAAASVHLPMP